MTIDEVWDYKFKRSHHQPVHIITHFNDGIARDKFGLYMSEMENITYPTNIMVYHARYVGEI